MKKFIVVTMIIAAIAACKSGTNTDAGPDTAATNTTPSSGNTDATMSQKMPADSVEMSSDSTGNIHPGDTTKGK